MKFAVAILILFVVGFIFLRSIDDVPKNFPQFVTEDLSGNVFTNKIFNGKLTAILLWTTNSEPCLKMLGSLDEFLKDLPPNCQVIGLIGDKNFDAAQVKNFSSIVQLKVNDDFAPLLTKIKIVPTVIFIDRHGNLIEPPQFVPNAKFIREELIRLSEKDSTKVRTLNFLHSKFFD